jgi:hypothetical protein
LFRELSPELGQSSLDVEVAFGEGIPVPSSMRKKRTPSKRNSPSSVPIHNMPSEVCAIEEIPLGAPLCPTSQCDEVPGDSDCVMTPTLWCAARTT